MTLEIYDTQAEITRKKKQETRMVIKKDLSKAIMNSIKEKGWTTEESVKFLGVDTEYIISLKNSETEKLSIDFMLEVLERLGFKLKMCAPAHQQFFITISKTL